MTQDMNRRQALFASAAAIAGAAVLPGAVYGAGTRVGRAAQGGGVVSAGSARRVLRLAHVTDMHIQPQRRADEGVAACLRHLNSLADRPELIVTGGDHVMDAFEAPEDRTRLQFELIQKAFRDHSGIPVEYCLGNHDIWGWNKGKSSTTGSEARWGKAWAIETLQLAKSYRSFDRAGWHFVVLDSVHTDPNNPDGYIGKLDEAQFDWLKGDLAGVPKTTPVLVISHIPILSGTVLLGAPDKKTNERKVSGGLLHVDSPELRELFAERGNVKLCLSGHIHRLDRVDFRGTSYVCTGAVSGNWWKGPRYETPEGYGVVDLFDDGSFRHEYVTYGWEADPS